MLTGRQLPRRKLQRLAADQHGYFTAGQALEIGFSYQSQKYHVDYGNWTKVGRGLFRVPDWPVGEHDHLVRWALWSGGKAVVSHITALSVHGLGDVDPATVHLSVPNDFRRTATGLTLHRPSPPPALVEERDGFRVTNPHRALAECADTRIEQSWLDGAAKEALDRGLTTARRLRDIAADLSPSAELGIQRALEAASR